MSFDELYDKIMEVWTKRENRGKNLADLFDEDYPGFDDEELKKDIIDSILAETLHRNDPMAQEILKRIKNKYR